MKAYQIIDESITPAAEIGFLLYYERQRVFCVEVTEKLPADQLPILFAAFAEKGIHSLDPDWSERWVRQRIVPTDRQNLGMMLRENGLQDYDPMRLLLRGHGRCAQDDCAIREWKQETLPDWLRDRLSQRLALAVPLPDRRALLGFADGKVRLADLKAQIEADDRLRILARDHALFMRLSLQPGGCGICWEDWLSIPLQDLREAGTPLPLTCEDLRSLLAAETLDTAAVCQRLDCSRQYVNRLTRDGNLTPLHDDGKTRLYCRSEVEKLRW